MLRRHWFQAIALGVFALNLVHGSFASAADKLSVLIVDGRNNHDWKSTTPVLTKWLEGSGLFTVAVATAPPRGEDVSPFAPDFAKYDAVLINYNDKELWSDKTCQALVDYVRGGGGLVIVHAGNNAFPDWPEFNDMIGLGWRGNSFGDRVSLNDKGEVVRTPKGEGPGAGHGPQHAYQMITRDQDHPITAGLPEKWMHLSDELYHGQRGPAQNMRILATAYSDAETKRGTGSHEPLLWVIPYGEGRVFTNLLGHSAAAMHCVGFGTTLIRGTEWAATGKVSDKSVPENFPTADETSTKKF